MCKSSSILMKEQADMSCKSMQCRVAAQSDIHGEKVFFFKLHHQMESQKVSPSTKDLV